MSKLNSNEEIWKDIAGYEGLYQVSNFGRVKSLGNKSNHKGAIILKQSDVQGYMCVGIRRDNGSKMVKVHRLVALAFIPNPECKTQINHKDGDKHNNVVSNLEWVTCAENIAHAEKTGLRNHPEGIDPRSKKVKQIDVLSGEVVAVYESMHQMARETGFSRANVTRCINSETYHPYGWKWERES